MEQSTRVGALFRCTCHDRNNDVYLDSRIFESKHMKGVESHIGVYGFENGIDPEFVGVVLVSNEKVPVKMTGTFSFHRIATSISIFQILILKQYLLLFACLLLMLSLVAIFLP